MESLIARDGIKFHRPSKIRVNLSVLKFLFTDLGYILFAVNNAEIYCVCKVFNLHELVLIGRGNLDHCTKRD